MKRSDVFNKFTDHRHTKFCYLFDFLYINMMCCHLLVNPVNSKSTQLIVRHYRLRERERERDNV